MGGQASLESQAGLWDCFSVSFSLGHTLRYSATVTQSHSDGASVLLGDECGRLTAIGWQFEQSEIAGGPSYFSRGTVRVRKVDMGSVPPPSSLTYLDASHVFVSSACGDSGVMRLALSQPKQSSPMSSPTSARPIPGRKGKSRVKTEEEASSWSIAMEDEDQRGIVDVKERWMNLAPLKDFCVVGEESGNIVCIPPSICVADGCSLISWSPLEHRHRTRCA